MPALTPFFHTPFRIVITPLSISIHAASANITMTFRICFQLFLIFFQSLLSQGPGFCPSKRNFYAFNICSFYLGAIASVIDGCNNAKSCRYTTCIYEKEGSLETGLTTILTHSPALMPQVTIKNHTSKHYLLNAKRKLNAFSTTS